MADVSKHDEVAAMVQAAAAAFGSVDIVVSNVGMRRMQPFLDIGIEDWDAVLATNLTPAFYLARNAIPHMQKRKWGRLILISGFDGFWGQVTKRAQHHRQGGPAWPRQGPGARIRRRNTARSLRQGG